MIDLDKNQFPAKTLYYIFTNWHHELQLKSWSDKVLRQVLFKFFFCEIVKTVMKFITC